MFLADEEDRLSSPVGGRYGPLLPETFSEGIPTGAVQMLRDRYRRGEILAIGDLRGPEADSFPAVVREPLVAAGIVSHLLIPFGMGETMLGFMTVERLEHRPWTPAEVRTAELVAADIGRAVHHARLYEQERRLVAEFRDVNRAKSDFLAAVSHELRTPLTAIVGYLQSVRPDADAKGVSLAADRSPGDLVVSGDPDQLGRAVANLLSNAVKFTPSGGQVRVETADIPGTHPSRQRVAQVTIRDTGMGIPQAEQQRLFERFFRASNAVRQAIPGPTRS